MNKKGVIIFDFDGVIVDSVFLMYKYTKKTMPFLNWQTYQRIFDNPIFIRSIKFYAKLFRKKPSKGLQSKRSQYTRDKLAKVKIIEGINELLENLSKDYLITLNTNASLENSVPILEKYNLIHYFSNIKTRDDLAYKAQKNRMILDEVNLASEKAIYITDSFRDVLDAREAGVKSIAVLTGVHNEKHFNKRKVKDNVIGIAKNTKDIEKFINIYFDEDARKIKN
jgi:beta-phosphoglucomutase-like phosphatase (HAD superfamily)